MKKISLFIMMLIAFSCFADEVKEIRKQKIKDIVTQAEKDWPDNYVMQVAQIDRQFESLEKIEKLKSLMQEK
jgi:hypothetical protein